MSECLPTFILPEVLAYGLSSDVEPQYLMNADIGQ